MAASAAPWPRCWQRYAPTPIEFIGMQDTFGESGSPAELIKKYGMTPKDIADAAKRAMRRKK